MESKTCPEGIPLEESTIERTRRKSAHQSRPCLMQAGVLRGFIDLLLYMSFMDMGVLTDYGHQASISSERLGSGPNGN